MIFALFCCKILSDSNCISYLFLISLQISWVGSAGLCQARLILVGLLVPLWSAGVLWGLAGLGRPQPGRFGSVSRGLLLFSRLGCRCSHGKEGENQAQIGVRKASQGLG